MIGTFFAIFYIPTWIATLDAMRRPQHQWVAAGLNRSWWRIYLVMSSIFGITGPILTLAYVFGCLPKFGSGSARVNRSNVNEFQRRQ